MRNIGVKKKKIIIISIIGLISALFLSPRLINVRANPGNRGVDIVEQGDTFEFQIDMITKQENQPFDQSEDVLSYDSRLTGDLLLNIMEVNKTQELITCEVLGIYNMLHYLFPFITDDTTTLLTSSLSYQDGDEDGIIESFFFSIYDSIVIPGSWEDNTASLDVLSQELEWIEGNVSSFDFTLRIDNASQKVDLSTSYKVETYHWNLPYDESLIYEYETSYSFDYDNFVLNHCEVISEITNYEIKNESYLSENNIYIINRFYTRQILVRKGSVESGGVPGYELLSFLGISSISIVGIIYIIKRKSFSKEKIS